MGKSNNGQKQVQKFSRKHHWVGENYLKITVTVQHKWKLFRNEANSFDFSANPQTNISLLRLFYIFMNFEATLQVQNKNWKLLLFVENTCFVCNNLLQWTLAYSQYYMSAIDVCNVHRDTYNVESRNCFKMNKLKYACTVEKNQLSMLQFVERNKNPFSFIFYFLSLVGWHVCHSLNGVIIFFNFFH